MTSNGTLYLAGARGGIDLVAGARIGDDILDLYRVDFVGDEIKLKLVSSKTKDSHPHAAVDALAEGESNFAAAIGLPHQPERRDASSMRPLTRTAAPRASPRSANGGITTWCVPDSPTLLPGRDDLPARRRRVHGERG